MKNTIYWIGTGDDYKYPEQMKLLLSKYVQEGNKRDFNFHFLSLSEISIGVNKKPFINYEGKNILTKQSAFIISSSDIHAQAHIFVKNLKEIIYKSDSILLNFPIFDSLILEDDKISQASVISNFQIPVLPTYWMSYNQYTLTTTTDLLRLENLPLIFKPNSSGRGFGILKATNVQEAVAIGNLIASSHLGYIAQPFIDQCKDVRFLFINGHLMYIKVRIPPKDGYLGNAAVGGSKIVVSEKELVNQLNILEPHINATMIEELLHISKNIYKKSEALVLSLDWLTNGKDYYFNEMCTSEADLSGLPQSISEHTFDAFFSLVEKCFELKNLNNIYKDNDVFNKALRISNYY